MSRFQVLGVSGATRPCLVALDMVLSGPLKPQRATILTKNQNEHLFVLWDSGDWPFHVIIIPTGFMSGYEGEGARGFSLALCMLDELRIPIYHFEVQASIFDKFDRGEIPEDWLDDLYKYGSECAMPIPGWVFVKHWELAKKHRLWRVQRWRETELYWTDEADAVDDFSWIVGDRLHAACAVIRRNAPSDICQSVGLTLRDAWIEFARVARETARIVPEEIGKSHVVAILDALCLGEEITRRSKKAYGATNTLQHHLNATWEEAASCFGDSVTAMCQAIDYRFPSETDYQEDELIRPN